MTLYTNVVPLRLNKNINNKNENHKSIKNIKWSYGFKGSDVCTSSELRQSPASFYAHVKYFSLLAKDVYLFTMSAAHKTSIPAQNK